MALEQYNHIFTTIGEYPENIELINNTMWKNKDKLFNTLMELQINETGIKRFDFVCDNTDENIIKTNKELTFLLNTDIIDVNDRQRFRKSKYYKNKIYNDEIITNQDMFDISLLVFIDGELYTNFYVTAEEDLTKVTFNISNASSNSEVRNVLLINEVNALFDKASKVTIIVLPSFKISQYEFLNKGMLNDLINGGLGIDGFTSLNNIESNDKFICMITYPDSGFFKYKPLYTTVENNRIHFIPNQFTSFPNTGKFYLRLYYIPNYNEEKEILNKKFFGLSIKENPIPTENILLFNISENKQEFYFDHDSKLTLFYPNIYEVTKNNNLNTIVFSLYKEQKYSDTTYINELKLYHKFASSELFNEQNEDRMADILSSIYENSRVDDYIKAYTAIHEEYDHEDFFSDGKEEYQYKIDKLRSLINKHGDFYSTYLDEVIDYNLRYPVEIPENLEQYKRLGNHSEFPNDISKHVVFDEECYLFIFNVCPFETLIYIGNEYFPPKYDFYDEEFRYLYIPTRLIDNNTVISKEPLPNNTFEKTFTVSTVDEYFKFEIDSQNKIPASDLFVTYNDNGVEKYLDSKSDYAFYKNYDNSMVKIELDDFYYYPNYYVKINNSNFINTELKVRVANKSLVFQNVGTPIFNFNGDVLNDESRFLFYKNGQLIPRNVDSVININFSDAVNGPHEININFKNNLNDVFTVVYTPTRYTTYSKYYKSSINTSGIVDLFGIIDKPLSFKWFDLYLNGYRLNEETAEFLGPYLLHVKNVKSSENLEIYEKYFKNFNIDGYVTEDITEYLYENIDGLKDTLDELLKDTLPAPNSPDSLPNILGNIIYDYLEFIEKYWVPNLKIINPDLQQFVDEFVVNYPNIADENNVFFINPNRDMGGVEMAIDIFFNPTIESR